MFPHLFSAFYLAFRQWGLFGVFVSMFSENVAFPLPIEIGYLSGVYLIETGAYPYWVVLAVLTLGHVIGASCAYALGKWGSDWLMVRLRNKGSFAEAERKIHHWYEKYGDITAFGVRFLGYVRLFSSYIAGIAEYNFWRFIAFTALGSLIFNMIGLSASGILIRVWREYAFLRVYIVAVMSISFFAFIAWGLMQKKGKKNICVVGVIQQSGKVLIGKKIGLYPTNGWHLPGGKIEKNETEIQALEREMKEETGLDIKVKEFLDEGRGIQDNVLVRYYLCVPMTIDVQPGGDLSDAQFVAKSRAVEVCDSAAVKLWPKGVLEYLKS